MKQFIHGLGGVMLATALAMPAVSQAETIKMGALATLEGAFTVLGEDSIRGVQLAIKEFNNTCLLYTSPSPRDRG